MYRCTHCNITFKDKDDSGILPFRGKLYCKNCEEPVEYIPDAPKRNGTIPGAQATLISNSDNRITTNNYYGGGSMPDEQIETPFGICKKSEAQFCKNCRQWVPRTFYNTDRGLCDICIEEEAIKAFEEGKSFYEMGVYDEALGEFLKYEPVCPKNELTEVKTLIGKCYYELKDYKQALRYFVVASRNNTDSLYYLGQCYYHGFGVPQDYKKAIEIIHNAAQKGNQLAVIFIREEEERKKEEERKRLIEAKRVKEEKLRREAELRKLEEEERRREKEQKEREYFEKLELHSVERNNRYGFADDAGRIIIPCNWKWAGSFSEGLANVKDFSGRMGFIDKTGKLVIPCVWKSAVVFNEGLSLVTDDSDKKGFIDKTGKLVIPCIWSNAISFFEGYAAVDCGVHKWVNHQLTGCKWGYIDKTGKIISPCKWDYAFPFKNGMGRVRVNGKYGYVDYTGKPVIPCIYIDGYDFRNGTAYVKGYDERWIYINKKGEIVNK